MMRRNVMLCFSLMATLSYSETNQLGRAMAIFKSNPNIRSIMIYDPASPHDLDERGIGTYINPVLDFCESIDSDTSAFEVDYIPGQVGVRFTGFYDKKDVLHEILEIDGTLTFSPPICSTNCVEVPSGSFFKQFPANNYKRWGLPSHKNFEPLVSVDTPEEADRYFLIACGEGGVLDLLELRFYGPFLKSERQQVKEMFAIAIKDKSKEQQPEFCREELLVSSNKWVAVLGLAMLRQMHELTESDFVRNPYLISANDTSILEEMFITAGTGLTESTLSEAMCTLMQNKDEAVVGSVLDKLVSWTRGGAYGACVKLWKREALLDDMEAAIRSHKGEPEALLEKLAIVRKQVDEFVDAEKEKN